MEGHAGVLADALDQLPEGFGGHGATALGLEDVRRCLLLALQAAQCAYLIALHWMHRRHAVLARCLDQLIIWVPYSRFRPSPALFKSCFPHVKRAITKDRRGYSL